MKGVNDMNYSTDELRAWLDVETEMIGQELRSGQPIRSVNDRFTRTVEAAVFLAVTEPARTGER